MTEQRERVARALREAFLAGLERYEEATEEGCEYDPEAKADELLALFDAEAEPVGWLPPERLPVLLGEKQAPRDKGSNRKAEWSRISHRRRRNKKGESYLALYLQPVPSREREAMEVFVPTHWRDTLTEHPAWIVSMTLMPDDGCEWMRVKVMPADAEDLEGSKDE